MINRDVVFDEVSTFNWFKENQKVHELILEDDEIVQENQQEDNNAEEL